MAIYDRSIRSVDYQDELRKKFFEGLERQREANRFLAARQASGYSPTSGTRYISPTAMESIDWDAVRAYAEGLAKAKAEADAAEERRRVSLSNIGRVADARAQGLKERSRQQAKAKAARFIAPGINTAYRAVARSRFAAAQVTKQNKPDDSLLGKAMRVAKATPGLNLIPPALKIADTGRRGVVAGAMEIGDALEVAAGRENQDTFGGRTRDTGFSWEDFKRNTLDDETNVGFGDIAQSGLDQAGVTEDTPILGNIWTRRVIGFAGDLATDPLTYIPVGVAASGLSKPTLRVGNAAMKRSADVLPAGVRRAQARVARDQFLKNTRRGRAIESEVRRVAGLSTDSAALMRTLPEMAPSVARSIANAPTKQAAQDLASRALRTGEYIPDISIRRQALVATTGRGLRASGGLGLGRRVVRESEGLFDVGGKARRIANRTKGPVAATVTDTTASARRATVKASLRKVGVRSGEAREMVAATSVGLTPWDRVNRLLIDIDAADGIVADVVEATLEKVLPKKQSHLSFNEAMADLADLNPVHNSPKVIQQKQRALDALLEAETLVATARGDFGEDAARQLRTELGVGYSRPEEANLDKLLRRAGNRAGLDVPAPGYAKVTKARLAGLGKRIEKEVKDDALKAELRASLSKLKTGKKDAGKLNSLAKNITLAADDDVAADALGMFARYGETLKDKVDLVGRGHVGLGQKVNPARALGKVVTSLTETIAPHQIRFLSTENMELAIQERVRAFDSYLGALGMEMNARTWLRQAIADVQTEADLFKAVDDALVVMANAEGVPPEILQALLKKTQKEARETGFKAVPDPDADTLVGRVRERVRADLLTEVQNLSQLTETVALPDPSDIKRTISDLRKGMDDPEKLAEIRRWLDEPTALDKVKSMFSWVHRTWKLMVVTNLYMPVVGGFAGFAGTEGDFEDRLKGGFQWAALGALAPTRYILRIGIEERLRLILTRGFMPADFIPGIAKWRATRGVDLPFVSAHLLSSGDPTGGWMRNELATRATGQFEAAALADLDGVMAKLGRRHPRYVDSWWRIVNHEINDANGALDRILLAHRAGYMTRAEVDKWFKAFLDSPDGELWWKRWKGAHGRPRDAQEAFERQLRFIEDYVPQDIARVRLPAFDADFQQVPRSLLKGHVKAKTAPAFIHAEKTWTIPRAKTFFQDVGHIKQQLTDKLIFGGPTRTIHRRPMARSIYKEEYTALIRGGVEPKLAQELADRAAINITNTVMFNQHNESRFAAKVDIVFPFQQPREELVRVWAPLVFNNKIRTLQLTSLGARALEAGASNGTFYEYTNPFTGEKEWRAKVPGSGTLSRALGGVNINFDFGLRDVLFLTQDNMGSTIGLPFPGGPFYTVMTRSFINAFPEHYGSLPSAVKDYLFPFGSSGRLGRNEPNRLWMSLMGTPAPWEFANEWEQKEEYRKIQLHMFQHLYLEHYKQTGEWKYPTDAEVKEATSAYLKTQAMLGAIWPAPTRYVQPWQELVEKAQAPFKDPLTGELDYFGFINEHPNMAPFVTGKGEFVGPDTFENWSRSDKEQAEDYIKHWNETVSLREFRKELEDNKLTAEAWQERNLIPFSYSDWELTDAYLAWESKWLEKHPSVVESTRTNYFRDQQLYRIMHMAEGPGRDRAIDEWRKKYNVSSGSYPHHIERLRREGFEVDYWKFSRPSEVVVQDVERQIRRTGNDWGAEHDIVSTLNPAEQLKYWKMKQRDLVFYEGQDAQTVLDDYYRYKNWESDIYRRYPKLAGGGAPDSRIEKMIGEWRGDVRGQIDAIYDEINVVSARFDELKAAGKSWSAEGQALYAKRSNLYDMVKALKNKQFEQLPGILEFFDDMAAVTALMKDDGRGTSWYLTAKGSNRRAVLAFQAMLRKPLGFGGFIPSNEELGVLSMPKEVRQAYTQDLIDQLNTPDGEKGKLFWEWLSDFQRSWLKKNVPQDMVKEWMGQEPRQQGSGWKNYKKRTYYGRGYWRNYGRSNSIQDGELGFAYAMFKQYTKRPEGAKPPAAYAEYLKLPANPALRNQFLDRHPEVGAWIAAGPVANMPAHIRYMVQNIMVKYGKWEGEIMSDSEVNDMAFAQEQLKRWNLRGSLQRPEAYDKWMQMPSGVEKAQYLKAHPEIAEWLRLGPMSNMPDAYQDVVRDIMQRYGKWTEETEGLGAVISGYYKTPSYAREQYLADHPELVDYWTAIRTPEEQKRAAMVDQYFSITDPNAQRAYLILHPELKEYFVQRRTERYENFLTQVAIYMGGHPEMFQHYLDRQEDILNDLLLRYAEPPLIRELSPLRDVQATERARRRS